MKGGKYTKTFAKIQARRIFCMRDIRRNVLPKFRDGPLEKLWGSEGKFSSRRNFFSFSNSLYEFFFRPQHKYFLGLIGLQEFFSFNFPLREFFLCTSPALPISFLMVRPLWRLVWRRHAGWASTWRTETERNVCCRILVQKHEFIPRGTHKH